ncbi:class II histone deacetylase [Thalassorhabdomicrobium marinisediminis]|uniref:Class II histone deacetylase n=1 Tax=Thalassorhabdomicrobium marinisediminis TaxID=2170577 RepID=A0A2T7FX21_9RHOB|nr:class II histone deacetylase [Thalassorhabdomicrobium marinisediminis]PVA06717.1 class II histone deacetylase [Thalassorhabdomicrobium marinisediminis]
MSTGFFWDERCFWHGGGNYAGMLPVGGLVQPVASGGLPESPESKRRLKNLMDVTGLSGDLALRGGAEAAHEDLLRVHPASYLDAFKAASDAGGGEMGRRTPFGPGGYEIAALSAGLSVAALEAVLRGELRNAYALSRPPGHHCLPDYPNGFCLMANLAIAIEAARAKGLAERVVVLDWDVHHGNGTEAIFYEDPDVLTISIHQERNYPMDTGEFADRGRGKGTGANLNVPLPPGVGHRGYLAALERIILPQIRAFQPDVIVIACGFDAAAIDPLGRMLATAETFRMMTQQVMTLADEICGGRLMMAHEGGYSEAYVPFCGHHVLQEMSGSAITAPDPFGDVFPLRQPGAAFDRFVEQWLAEMAEAL